MRGTIRKTRKQILSMAGVVLLTLTGILHIGSWNGEGRLYAADSRFSLENSFTGKEEVEDWSGPTISGSSMGTTLEDSQRDGVEISNFRIDFSRNFTISATADFNGGAYLGMTIGLAAADSLVSENYSGYGQGLAEDGGRKYGIGFYTGVGIMKSYNTVSFNAYRSSKNYGTGDGFSVMKYTANQAVEVLKDDTGEFCNNCGDVGTDVELEMSFVAGGDGTGTLTVVIGEKTFTYSNFDPAVYFGSAESAKDVRFVMTVHDNSTEQNGMLTFSEFNYSDVDLSFGLDAYTVGQAGDSVADTIGKNDKIYTDANSDVEDQAANYAMPGETILVRQLVMNRADIQYNLDERVGYIQVNIPRINLNGAIVSPEKVYYGVEADGSDATEITAQCYNRTLEAGEVVTADITVPANGEPAYVYYELTIPADYKGTGHLQTNLEASMEDITQETSAQSDLYTIKVAGLPTLSQTAGTEARIVTKGDSLTEQIYVAGLQGQLYDSAAVSSYDQSTTYENQQLQYTPLTQDQLDRLGIYAVTYTLLDTRTGLPSQESATKYYTVVKDEGQVYSTDSQVMVNGQDVTVNVDDFTQGEDGDVTAEELLALHEGEAYVISNEDGSLQEVTPAIFVTPEEQEQMNSKTPGSYTIQISYGAGEKEAVKVVTLTLTKEETNTSATTEPKAETKTTVTTEPKAETNKTVTTRTVITCEEGIALAPQTGDGANVIYLLLLVILCLGAILALACYRGSGQE